MLGIACYTVNVHFSKALYNQHFIKGSKNKNIGALIILKLQLNCYI